MAGVFGISIYIKARVEGHTLKRLEIRSVGASEIGAADDVNGFKGPSITIEVGTASSSLNSLLPRQERMQQLDEKSITV